MPKGRNFVLCALLFAPLFLRAQQEPPSSTDELVRIGLAQNKDLLAIREGIAEAKGLKRQAGVRPAPILSLRGATGRPLGTVGEDIYGGDVTQEIETFGKRGKRIQVAGYDIAKAEVELQDKSAQLAYEIRTALAERRAEQDKLKMLSQLVLVNQDALRLTEARVREGDVAPLEANLLKVEIAKTGVLRNNAQGRLTTAEATLRRLLGMSMAQPIPPVASEAVSTDGLDLFEERALQARADIRGARVSEDQLRDAVTLAKANAKPNVNLSAGYTRQNSQFDDLYGTTTTGAVAPLRDRDDILSVGVSMPLRSTRSGKGEIEAANARANAARLHREFLEHSIPIEVSASYQRLATAKESLALLGTDVVDASAKNLEVIREAYKLGQLRLLDVLNEQRQVVDTHLAYIEAQAELARSWAELERTIGGNLP